MCSSDLIKLLGEVAALRPRRIVDVEHLVPQLHRRGSNKICMPKQGHDLRINGVIAAKLGDVPAGRGNVGRGQQPHMKPPDCPQPQSDEQMIAGRKPMVDRTGRRPHLGGDLRDGDFPPMLFDGSRRAVENTIFGEPYWSCS